MTDVVYLETLSYASMDLFRRWNGQTTAGGGGGSSSIPGPQGPPGPPGPQGQDGNSNLSDENHNTFADTNALLVKDGNLAKYNNAYGERALMKNTVGYGNSVFGYESMVNNMSGSFNTAAQLFRHHLILQHVTHVLVQPWILDSWYT